MIGIEIDLVGRADLDDFPSRMTAMVSESARASMRSCVT
jgi:hypothetical protein